MHCVDFILCYVCFVKTYVGAFGPSANYGFDDFQAFDIGLFYYIVFKRFHCFGMVIKTNVILVVVYLVNPTPTLVYMLSYKLLYYTKYCGWCYKTL